MKVLKFGGSSVGSADRIRQIARIIGGKIEGDVQVIAVFSAFGGITDQLIECGRMAANGQLDYKNLFQQIEQRHLQVIQELLTIQSRTNTLTQIKIRLNELEEILHGVFLVKELTPKTLDYIMSFGERLSAYIINEVFCDQGLDSLYVDAREIVRTDDNFGRARIRYPETNENIKSMISASRQIYVVTGFIGSTENNETTTIGRGGSDYTASLFGAALDVDEIEIWTDVNGVMTADPSKVSSAFPIRQLTYEEAMELSHFGAKVIYPPTMQPALDKKIPIRVMNTLQPGFAGTVICDERDQNQYLIKGISSIDQVCLILIQGSGMIGVAGIAQRIFSSLAREAINIILISQASSEHSICLAVMPEHAQKAKKALEKELYHELRDKQVNEISVEKNMTILAVVGEKMRHTRGIAARVFSALGRNGINISAIAQGSSELNISLVIAQQDEAKALNTLHDAFFLSATKSLHLYLAGVGLIGRTFLSLLHTQASQLAEQHGISIKLVGVTNSRKMVISREGINPEKCSEIIEKSDQDADVNIFIRKMKELNLPNSIFVDCTANDQIPVHYPEIFDLNISIVTPNKIANSLSYGFYQELRVRAKENNVMFQYETNVGAALPIINTIRDLVSSGDRVIKLEGMLSGTLSYIFSKFDGSQSFSSIIHEAKEMGYTEPDPREDLSGMDVARKLLILIREAGVQAEPENIRIEKLLSPRIEKAHSVEEAMNLLGEADAGMEKRRKSAAENDQLLRYIARYEDGAAEVCLKSIGKDHPFAQVSGTENIIAIYSQHYGENPLIVRGPGAGKDVTAAGVFADVLRIANRMM